MRSFPELNRRVWIKRDGPVTWRENCSEIFRFWKTPKKVLLQCLQCWQKLFILKGLNLKISNLNKKSANCFEKNCHTNDTAYQCYERETSLNINKPRPRSNKIKKRTSLLVFLLFWTNRTIQPKQKFTWNALAYLCKILLYRPNWNKYLSETI